MHVSIVNRRARRAVLRGLLGGALAALLAVAVGNSASGGATADIADAAPVPASSDRTDVFIKDIPNDVGNEPHGYVPSSYFNSPDISICPTAVLCSPSTDPVVGSTSYIFVNLRNPGPYGSGVGTGTLRAYYTTSGGGANWPAHWTPIGSVAVTVPAGVTTAMIPWPNVPSLGHFCLLVRWDSADDPMIPEGVNTSLNTQYNNNIAWKNANTVPVAPGGGSNPSQPYAMANGLAQPAEFGLVFRPLNAQFPGRIVADLGAEMFQRWQRAGQQGAGIRAIGRNQIEIVNPGGARIDGLLINPDERPVIRLNFASAEELRQQYLLRVVQVGPIRQLGERFEVGGVDYTLVPAKR